MRDLRLSFLLQLKRLKKRKQRLSSLRPRYLMNHATSRKSFSRSVRKRSTICSANSARRARGWTDRKHWLKWKRSDAVFVPASRILLMIPKTITTLKLFRAASPSRMLSPENFISFRLSMSPVLHSQAFQRAEGLRSVQVRCLIPLRYLIFACLRGSSAAHSQAERRTVCRRRDLRIWPRPDLRLLQRPGLNLC